MTTKTKRIPNAEEYAIEFSKTNKNKRRERSMDEIAQNALPSSFN